MRAAELVPSGELCDVRAPRGIHRLSAASDDCQEQAGPPLGHNDIEARLRAREAELARVQKIGQVGGLEVDLRGGAFTNRRSPEYLRVHGLPPEAASETHEAWVARIHPDDRQRTEQHFREAVTGRAMEYEAEYRIIRPSDGEVRWILAKAEIERDVMGKAVRLVGAHIDITDRRSAEEQTELIAQELSHRIKNIFAVINSLVMLSARGKDGDGDFARALCARIGALGQAHEFVRRHALGQSSGRDAQSLKALLDLLLAPYRSELSDQISVAGDDAVVGEQAATALSLVIHELATNAVKYGSLSMSAGRLSVICRVAGEAFVMTWQERNGPGLNGRPGRQGFGTMMSERAAKSQLGAVVRHDWAAEGLTIDLEIPLAKLAR
ncbi:PAS domain-containing protein [Phreatobacter aquaticus]|uniref:PAS domain-containing protein n=1 Tax=Phreatobacter aquaticus TaxID=2570229 RepID=UPI00208FDD9E